MKVFSDSHLISFVCDCISDRTTPSYRAILFLQSYPVHHEIDLSISPASMSLGKPGQADGLYIRP